MVQFEVNDTSCVAKMSIEQRIVVCTNIKGDVEQLLCLVVLADFVRVPASR